MAVQMPPEVIVHGLGDAEMVPDEFVFLAATVTDCKRVRPLEFML
jgi:hypothetical protein